MYKLFLDTESAFFSDMLAEIFVKTSVSKTIRKLTLVKA